MKMVIVTSTEGIQEGAHLVSEELYGEIALLILTRTHPEWMRDNGASSAAARYVDGMNLYGAIISLQEASRWLESGYIDHAKTDVDVALKQLQEIADRNK